ncbi:MAG: hypothetical protein IJT88_06310, partial [Kiritimatiellae bacterium]|nr:hypothetical protein [Kiritimatiellia bacterium]
TKGASQGTSRAGRPRPQGNRPYLTLFAHTPTARHGLFIWHQKTMLARDDELHRAFCEHVWPQGSEEQHPVAPKFIARLEAAPPEAARQMATVI